MSVKIVRKSNFDVCRFLTDVSIIGFIKKPTEMKKKRTVIDGKAANGRLFGVNRQMPQTARAPQTTPALAAARWALSGTNFTPEL